MSKFVEMVSGYVNTSYILRVDRHPNGTADIYMIDGSMYCCPDFDFEQLTGSNEIVEVISCDDLDAVYNHNGAKTKMPVKHLFLTGDGQVLPVEDFTPGLFDNGKWEFLGLCDHR